MTTESTFWIDTDMVEHGCCWDTAVVTRCPEGEGQYGTDVSLVCECRNEHAQFICDALNAAVLKKAN